MKYKFYKNKRFWSTRPSSGYGTTVKRFRLKGIAIQRDIVRLFLWGTDRVQNFYFVCLAIVLVLN